MCFYLYEHSLIPGAVLILPIVGSMGNQCSYSKSDIAIIQESKFKQYEQESFYIIHHGVHQLINV